MAIVTPNPFSDEKARKENLAAFLRGFTSNPYIPDGNPGVIATVLGGSPLIDALRQLMPERLGSTQAGQALFDVLAGGSPADSLRTRAAQLVTGVPLGGYSAQRMRDFYNVRSDDFRVASQSQEIGRVPSTPGGFEERSTTGRPDLLASQLAGTAANDLMSDGLRNIWWFLNAPQALASIGVLHAINAGGDPFREAAGIKNRPFLKNPRLRFAATTPAWIATSAAVGSGMRLPGYAAAVPSEEDKTKTDDPVAEALTRFFLGRAGPLLPYDKFVKERPDVSRGEYERYKQYLFESKAPLKFTAEGIHGPEVTFMGKSIPVTTGLLPAVAAGLGTWYGVRRAGRMARDSGRLAAISEQVKTHNREYAKLKKLEASKLNAAQREMLYDNRISELEKIRPDWAAQRAIEQDAGAIMDQLYNKNDLSVLGQALLFSSGGAVGAGALGMALESIRRSLPDREPEGLPRVEASATGP